MICLSKLPAWFKHDGERDDGYVSLPECVCIQIYIHQFLNFHFHPLTLGRFCPGYLPSSTTSHLFQWNRSKPQNMVHGVPEPARRKRTPILVTKWTPKTIDESERLSHSGTNSEHSFQSEIPNNLERKTTILMLYTRNVYVSLPEGTHRIHTKLRQMHLCNLHHDSCAYTRYTNGPGALLKPLHLQV